MGYGEGKEVSRDLHNREERTAWRKAGKGQTTDHSARQWDGFSESALITCAGHGKGRSVLAGPPSPAPCATLGTSSGGSSNADSVTPQGSYTSDLKRDAVTPQLSPTSS